MDAVELIGNAWRVISVHNELASAAGNSGKKSLNSDEFGANGAALFGVYLDNKDRVRFEVWDAFPYEVSISVDDVCSTGAGLRAVAIPRGASVPLLYRGGSGGVFTARVYPVRDFSAVLVYSGAPSSDDKTSHSPGVLDTYAVTGLESALARADGGGGRAVPKWVDVRVSVDLYGLVGRRPPHTRTSEQ